MSKKLTGTTKCVHCKGTAEPVQWKPEPGYDHRLRKFKCRTCGLESYVVVNSLVRLQAIDGN